MSFRNRYRRLNNLYKIINKEGKSVVFRMNDNQKQIYRLEKEHKRVIILKARQLWMSTYKLISSLDYALFYPNKNIVITAHKQEKMWELFQKIKYAFECIPDKIDTGEWIWEKPIPKYDSKNEYYFPHNNSRVKISLDSRSWTVTDLHITELAFRNDAQDMMTGTLPAVPRSSQITIETTANWVWNYFHSLRWKASSVDIDFYPVFIPRYTDPNYYLETNEEQVIPSELSHLESLDLTDGQIAWYINQWKMLWRDVFQEYPSTPEESFLTTGDNVFNQGVVQWLQVLDYKEDEKIPWLRIYGRSIDPSALWVDTAAWWVNWDFSAIVGRDKDGRLLCAYYWHATPEHQCEVIDRLVNLWYWDVIGIENNNTGLATITHSQKYSWHENLYRTIAIDDITQKEKKVYWWNTNTKTRPIMISDYRYAVNQWELTEFDERWKSEAMTFVYNEKNKPEAIQWSHDDFIMADAICLQMLPHIPAKVKKWMVKASWL